MVLTYKCIQITGRCIVHKTSNLYCLIKGPEVWVVDEEWRIVIALYKHCDVHLGTGQLRGTEIIHLGFHLQIFNQRK